ncbi:SusC/RagA family TonB-linked outer membrane protein [Zobellia uliginosa]|uniref:SusC/RagA family TonB-linked outer membrane protein n=1 Tax=Zobellia uliginosa TaxID=143224 RepID=UPI001C0729D4|nr:TonB-dependent receptor [Zobellia uliginosa]MBU2946200.1 TonB-dependent receptor [Zobellia uliginosa]
MKEHIKKLFRKSCLLALFLTTMGMQGLYAQKTVTGTVLDEVNQPIPGANVVVQGTSNGVVTDFDGNFSIEASGENTLSISYIGYATQTVTVGDKTTITVTMEPDVQQLEDVVVIGYGTVKKSDVTGSVSRIDSKSFEDQPLTRVEEALQGRAAGVTVAKAGGQPGGAVKVRIRGVNSVTGNNSPLVVVDGVLGGDLSTINPNDIAAMDVLKDASATAIYGVRGSNGVIIITTKKGSGKGKINVDYFTTVSSSPNSVPRLSASDFATIENLRRTNSGGAAVYTPAQIAALEASGGTDYEQAILRTGFSENLAISASGSEGKIRYYLSGNYRDEEGVVINTGYQQISARANIDAQINDKFKIGFNLYGSTSENQNNTDRFGNGQGSFIYKALTWDPTTPIFNSNGEYNIRSAVASLNDNPVRTLNETDIKDIEERLNATVNATYSFTDNFSYSLIMGSQTSNLNIERYAVEVGDDQLPHTSFANNKNVSYQISNILTWQKIFKEKHNIKLTGVQEYSNSKFRGNGWNSNDLSLNGRGFYFAELAPNSGQTVNNDFNERELSSFMLRAEYIFNDNLFLTATGRYDASSVFREKERWGIFPSVALAYNMTDLIDQSGDTSLKLRAGWGQVGNQNIGPYSTFSTLGFNSYAADGSAATTGTFINRIGNPFATWETTTQGNVGIDFGFAQGRGSISLDGYKKVTEDLLLDAAIPDYDGGELGDRTIVKNVGEVENVGVDLTIGYDIINTENLNWNANLSLSYVKNEVTQLNDGLTEILGQFQAPGGQGNILNFIEVGEPLGQFRGATFLGTWKTTDNIPTNDEGTPIAKPGEARYLLDDNNEILYGAIGNGTPTTTWGFNNSINYKNWDINIFLQGVHGFDVYNIQQAAIVGGAGDSRSFLSPDQVNQWTPTNETDIPAFAGLYESSRYVEKGDFIRLSNLTIGYTIKDIKGLGDTTIKLYGGGQNLFLITDYSGYDPEGTSRRSAQGNEDVASGINIGAYPNPRTYTLGVKIGF